MAHVNTLNNKSDNNSIEQALQTGLRYHRAGQLSQAEAVYKKIIHAEPGHHEALHYLGLIAYQTGNNNAAIELINKAIHINANSPIYFSNIGEIYRVMYRYEEALASFRRALAIKDDLVDAHVGIGNVLMDQESYEQAIASYRVALSLMPDYAEVHNNIGNVLMAQGDFEEALASYNKALSLKPDYAEALSNLGCVYRSKGEDQLAFDCYRKALALQPDSSDAHVNLGILYRGHGQYDRALACYRKALEFKPDFTDAHINLGNLYREQGLHELALASYRKALELNPELAETHLNLGILHREDGRNQQALTCYQKALELKPNYAEARMALAMAQIPVIYGLDDVPRMCRDEFTRELSALVAWFSGTRNERGYQAIGDQQPFYLAYQEDNNRRLLAQYGELCTRLMDNWSKKQGFVYSENITRDILRVGIISAHIRNHSVWDAIVKGWLLHIDRKRIELSVFHIGSICDAETEWAESHSDFFTQGGKNLNRWVEEILGRRLDVLIYPEIGMDSMTAKLASMRLAPVQMAAWGHPETTGLPTMDYYLSAEYFEPCKAQENYTEKLVPLPNLGCCYHPQQHIAREPDFSGLGIDLSYPVFLCPGAPFKYMPQYDWVLAEIAHRVGRCRFVFFNYHFPGLSVKLHRRIEYAFKRAGLVLNDHVVFIPWQERSKFYGLMEHADVFLDTIGFSGFNTAMQAVECGLPVVAHDGRFMRGRLASGILRRMGLPELVANSEEEYISLVTRLAQDADYRNYIRQCVEINRLSLFDDLVPVRALEELLINVAEGYIGKDDRWPA